MPVVRWTGFNTYFQFPTPVDPVYTVVQSVSIAMPQLVAFSRRWTIGSDDFVFPGLMEIVLRIAW